MLNNHPCPLPPEYMCKNRVKNDRHVFFGQFLLFYFVNVEKYEKPEHVSSFTKWNLHRIKKILWFFTQFSINPPRPDYTPKIKKNLIPPLMILLNLPLWKIIITIYTSYCKREIKKRLQKYTTEAWCSIIQDEVILFYSEFFLLFYECSNFFLLKIDTYFQITWKSRRFWIEKLNCGFSHSWKNTIVLGQIMCSTRRPLEFLLDIHYYFLRQRSLCRK